MSPSAIDTFRELSTPRRLEAGARRFTAVPLLDWPMHKLAKDEHGRPYLLLSVSTEGSRRAPIVLENVEVQHGVACIVTTPEGAQERASLTIVGCTQDDSILHAYFLQAAGAIAPLLGAAPTAEDVARGVAKLAELFRLMSAPPRKSVQGLWAELLVIAGVRDPSLLLSAWHATTADLYDFNSGAERIEVKSAAGRERKHHFRLEQLEAPAGTRVTIASVLVEPSGAGVTIDELSREILERGAAPPALAEKLMLIIAATLGSDWRRAYDMTFDREAAEASLMFFDASDIPRVDSPQSPEVTNVHFTANLARVPALSGPRATASGPLVASALRRQRGRGR